MSNGALTFAIVTGGLLAVGVGLKKTLGWPNTHGATSHRDETDGVISRRPASADFHSRVTTSGRNP